MTELTRAEVELAAVCGEGPILRFARALLRADDALRQAASIIRAALLPGEKEEP